MTKEEKLTLLIDLSNKELTNRQLSVILEVKVSTICAWKKILRNKGFAIGGKSGRPALKPKTDLSTSTPPFTPCNNNQQ